MNCINDSMRQHLKKVYRESMVFRFKERTVNFADRALVMGILNVTPDSFSEDGLNFSPKIAIKSGLRMVDEGADIIDIGGESTRPGADPITAHEEINRILPVIHGFRALSDIPISVDTYKSDVAKVALENGADIINDISGFQHDDDMKDVAKKYNAGCIIMHMRGTPKTMQRHVEYNDIIAEISNFFRQSIHLLSSAGVEREFMCLDPGIGFSKTTDQNLYLISNISIFTQFALPLLIGPSRKSFIGQALKIDSPKDRVWGTAATVCYALDHGVHIVRVHDVKEMRQICNMTNALISARVEKKMSASEGSI